MSLFKKEPSNENESLNKIIVDGETKKVIMYSYFIYNRSEDKIYGAIQLTEEQADGLNAFMKSIDMNNNISFIRS